MAGQFSEFRLAIDGCQVDEGQKNYDYFIDFDCNDNSKYGNLKIFTQLN